VTIEEGVLNRRFRVRLINCSSNGCLLESHAPLKVGTVGVVEIAVGNRQFSDTIQVMRCQAISGSPGVHHIGARLLPTMPLRRESLRHAMRCESGQVTTPSQSPKIERRSQNRSRA